MVLLGNGGTLASARALGALFVAASLAVLARSSDDRLQRASHVAPLAVVAALLALATVASLLPLPRALLEILAPGTAEARPHDAWWTAALRPAGPLDALARLALVAGAGLAAAVGLAARRRTVDLAAPARVALGVWLAFGLLHVASGSDRIAGVVTHQSDVAPFFAPMVNANHWATVVLLLLPSATLSAGRAGPSALPSLLLGLAGSAGVLLTGSVAASALLPAAWLAPHVSRRGLWVVAACCIGAGAAGVGVASALHRDWVGASVGGRAGHVRDALTLVVDHPAFGPGAGNFGTSFSHVDRDGMHHALGHLHSDGLEWVIERGSVGLGLAVVALALLVRAWPRNRAETLRAPALLGATLVGAHSLVDFPLHLAGPAMVTAAAFGVAWAAGERAALLPAARVRAGIAAFAVAALLGAGWEARSATREWLLAGRPATAAALFPNHPTTRLAAIDAALAAARTEDARNAAAALAHDHPDDADVLRRAALRQAAAGDGEGAERSLVRALARSPADARAWLARARLARSRGDAVAVDYYAAALRAGSTDPRALDEALATLPVPAAWVESLHDAPASTLLLLAKRARAEHDPWSEADALWRAVQRNPAAYGRLAELGPALARAGRPREGEAWLRHLVAEDPYHYQAWMALGNHLAAHGAPEEAVRALHTAGDGIPVALARAVEVSWSFGGTAAGRALLVRLEQEGRANPWLHLVAARMDAEDGRGAACRQRIVREGLADGPPVQAEARRVVAACGP